MPYPCSQTRPHTAVQKVQAMNTVQVLGTRQPHVALEVDALVMPIH